MSLTSSIEFESNSNHHAAHHQHYIRRKVDGGVEHEHDHDHNELEDRDAAGTTATTLGSEPPKRIAVCYPLRAATTTMQRESPAVMETDIIDDHYDDEDDVVDHHHGLHPTSQMQTRWNNCDNSYLLPQTTAVPHHHVPSPHSSSTRRDSGTSTGSRSGGAPNNEPVAVPFPPHTVIYEDDANLSFSSPAVAKSMRYDDHPITIDYNNRMMNGEEESSIHHHHQQHHYEEDGEEIADHEGPINHDRDYDHHNEEDIDGEAALETSDDLRQPDRFGFLGGSGKEMTIPAAVFRRRESKWLEMLDNWQLYMTKRFDKVKSRCRKGIPSSLRPRAWKYLCGAQFFMTSSKTRNIFVTYDNRDGDPHWNSEIRKDLNRQYPDHEMFSQSTAYGKFGQEDLFRVLKAWTLLHPDEGYCQAQAPIAAALLMHMPAHEAFYCFAQICQKYLPGYFSPGLEGIQLDGDILFGLLKKHSYSSYKHLKKQSIDPVLYMVEWFMCIFCRTLPWPCVLRVLDMFFCEGVKVLFKVGVFLFKYGLSSREQLRACPTMYDTIERLRHLPIDNLNEEYLVQKVTEMNITDEDLERVHYKQIKDRKKKQQKQQRNVTI